MKILLFRSDPSIMNIDSYNSQEIGLAKAYIKKGHSCDIVYYNGKEKSRIQEIKADDEHVIRIFWMKGFSFLNNGFFPGISQLVEQYDVIQVSEYYFWGSWYIYRKFGKKKKVYVYQGVYDSDNSSRFKLRCKIMDPLMITEKLRKSLPIFTKSKLAEDSMRRRGFQKVKTVGVGLDITRFDGNSELSDWTRNLIDSKGQKKYLLYVGTLEDRRNTLFLIDLFKRVEESFYGDVSLIIVGCGNGEYCDACKKKISSLNLGGKVIYKDRLPQSELEYVYKNSDVFLLPSKYEIFGMVIMESMAFGLPVISSYNGGSSTLIRDNENGRIIKSFDLETWTNAVLMLLNDNELLEKMSIEAKSTGSKQFLWDAIAGTILEGIDENEA